jgi:hypothetical protein
MTKVMPRAEKMLPTLYPPSRTSPMTNTPTPLDLDVLEATLKVIGRKTVSAEIYAILNAAPALIAEIRALREKYLCPMTDTPTPLDGREHNDLPWRVSK